MEMLEIYLLWVAAMLLMIFSAGSLLRQVCERQNKKGDDK